MSDQPPYPPPPGQDPYGQRPSDQNPYAQPPQGQPYGYGQPPQGPPQGQPYGQNPYGGPVYAGQTPTYDYAGWGVRVGASLIDGLLGLVAAIPLIVGYIWLFASLDTTSSSSGSSSADYDGGPIPIVLLVVGSLITMAFWIWNLCIRQGRTGQTLGKSNLGIRLVKESTGQPIGAGLSFVRQLCHYVDQLVCYLGYLWPLWDAKKQTLADKIMSTVVVRDR